MCSIGDIKHIPDFSYGKSGFFIVGSSCAICHLSKTVLHLYLADSCVELESMTHQPTDQPKYSKWS